MLHNFLVLISSFALRGLHYIRKDQYFVPGDLSGLAYSGESSKDTIINVSNNVNLHDRGKTVMKMDVSRNVYGNVLNLQTQGKTIMRRGVRNLLNSCAIYKS